MSYIKHHITKNCQQYIPTHPEKYVGKEKLIICRSTWEMRMCQWLDFNPGVLEWCSECLGIPYQDPNCPINPKTHKIKIRTYYPDFYMAVKTAKGDIQRFIIEVKPHKETAKPRNSKNKSTTTLIYENATFKTNQAKWIAAERYCKAHGLLFKILTEREIFGK